MANGRLEKELRAEQKMMEMLKDLPQVFSEFYYSMRASKKSYTTMTAYIRYVKNFMDFVTQGQPSNDFYKNITSTDIEQYLISLETRTSGGNLVRMGDSIQATRWSALNTFFDFLVNKKEYLKKNPMSKTDRPSINTENTVTALTKKEISQIIWAVRQNPSPSTAIRDEAIITLAIATGLRVSALTNINIEDIDFDNNVIHVIEKRNRSKAVPIGSQVKEVLQKWIAVRNEEFASETTALFVSHKRNRISIDAVSDMIKKYAAQVGITKNITPHVLRKTAATLLLSAGVDVKTVADILGHKNLNTIMKYLAALNENKAKAVQILDGMF